MKFFLLALVCCLAVTSFINATVVEDVKSLDSLTKGAQAANTMWQNPAIMLEGGDLPEAEVTKPEAEVTKPEAEVTKPEETEEEQQPEAEVTKPEAEVTKPEAEVTKPEAEVTKPEAEVTKPEAEVTKPEAEVTKPEAEVTKPEETEEGQQPEAEVTKPDAEVTKPEETEEGQQPEAEVTKPEAEVTKPEAEVTKPEAAVTKPEAEVTKPEEVVPVSIAPTIEPTTTPTAPQETGAKPLIGSTGVENKADANAPKVNAATGQYDTLKCKIGSWLDGDTCYEAKLSCVDGWSEENETCHDCPYWWGNLVSNVAENKETHYFVGSHCESNFWLWFWALMAMLVLLAMLIGLIAYACTKGPKVVKPKVPTNVTPQPQPQTRVYQIHGEPVVTRSPGVYRESRTVTHQGEPSHVETRLWSPEKGKYNFEMQRH